MEKTDTISNENSETGESKEIKQMKSLNLEIEKAVEEFFKSEQELEISKFFSIWILKFIELDIFLLAESNYKLYDLFRQFNQTLIKAKSTTIDHRDTTPTKSEHFEIESNLIEEMIKKAREDQKIFQFILSPEWNKLRIEYCNKDNINYDCIESLEKMIMFQNLIQLKIDKYGLKQGW